MPDDITAFLDAWIMVGASALVVVLLGVRITRGWGAFFQRHRYHAGRHVRQHERMMARKARRWRHEAAKLQARARPSETA